MKMFSDCSGECCVCSVGDGCMAGHGDDDYSPASKEQILRRLKTDAYGSYRDYMIGFLKSHYGYDYVDNDRPLYLNGDTLIKVLLSNSDKRVLSVHTDGYRSDVTIGDILKYVAQDFCYEIEQCGLDYGKVMETLERLADKYGVEKEA